MRTAIGGMVLTLAIVLLEGMLTPGPQDFKVARAQSPQESEPMEEPKYVGMTKCAACHFKQYTDWKTSAHGKAYEHLPSKYKTNAECLQCHTTGFGQPSVSEQAAAVNRMGVSCEGCHGPGGNHAQFALTFVGQERELTEDLVKVLRSKIQRTALDQCIKCHISKAHQPHPPFDREEVASDKQAQLGRTPARSFFQIHD